MADNNNPAGAFDPGTWAAVRSLIKVLRAKGVLDIEGFADVCEEMLKREQVHRDAGEGTRADDVKLAAQQIALITDDPG